jgi:hypothetical protein
MRIKKVIEVAIDVVNCIDIYSNDENIKRILINRFEKRCFRGCYIISVDEVKRVSECIISQDGHPTFGTISVCFQVTAEEYAEGEIINGCSITKITESGIIVCETRIASIMLKSNDLLQGVKQGQFISVRVGASKYLLGAEKIAVNAVPFLPARIPVVYLINGTFSSTDLFDNVKERILFEETELEKLRKNPETKSSVSVFTQMLFTSDREPTVSAQIGNIKNIADDGKVSGKYISRSLIRDLTTPNVLLYDQYEETTKTKMINHMTFENVVLFLLEDYCSHLRTVREMVGIYNTPELIKGHDNLWRMFKKARMVTF